MSSYIDPKGVGCLLEACLFQAPNEFLDHLMCLYVHGWHVEQAFERHHEALLAPCHFRNELGAQKAFDPLPFIVRYLYFLASKNASILYAWVYYISNIAALL